MATLRKRYLFILLVLAASYLMLFRMDWLAVPPFQKIHKANAQNMQMK